MSAESFSNGLSDEQEFWLKDSLYGVYGEIPVEPDCDTLDAQLCRDVYYESEGSQIDFAGMAEITVYQETGFIKLVPIGETPQGILCELLNPEEEPSDTDEPEFLLVCGTVFDIDIDTYIERIEPVGDEIWPVTSAPLLIEDYIKDRSSILLNRRIATFGHLAVRESYTPAEFHEYSEIAPNYYVPNRFQRAEISYKGQTRVRAISKATSLLKQTTGIVATYLDGSKKQYGAIFEDVE